MQKKSNKNVSCFRYTTTTDLCLSISPQVVLERYMIAARRENTLFGNIPKRPKCIICAGAYSMRNAFNPGLGKRYICTRTAECKKQRRKGKWMVSIKLIASNVARRSPKNITTCVNHVSCQHHFDERNCLRQNSCSQQINILTQETQVFNYHISINLYIHIYIYIYVENHDNSIKKST